MPVRRSETSPIFAARCYVPNSFVGSRHQERLVSDRRTRAPRGRHAGLRAPDKPDGSHRPPATALLATEHLISDPIKVAHHSSNNHEAPIR